MKSLTKMQIETAEAVLRDALRKKENELTEIAFKKDITKYKPALDAFGKMITVIQKNAKKLKETIEKNPNLSVGCSYGTVERYLFEDSTIKMDDVIRASDNYNKNPYAPNMVKEYEQVNQFILELKLGTALMSDLKNMLDMIAKIK